jgi:hypothetical protein
MSTDDHAEQRLDSNSENTGADPTQAPPVSDIDLGSNTESTSEEYAQAPLVPSSNSESTSDGHAQKLVGVVRTPASKNALVHGLYAADILLPWESEEEFETLFRELQEEWKPVGRQEIETVLSLARLNFLKHRLMRSTQIVFRSDPLAAEVEQTGASSWREIAASMQKHATDQQAFEKEIRSDSQALVAGWHTVCKSMTAQDKDSREIKATVEQMFMDYKPLYTKLKERLKDKPRTLAEQAYYPEYLEKLMKLEASIDTRIDKLLQRLVTLQEYRRLNETKTIAAPVSSKD